MDDDEFPPRNEFPARPERQVTLANWRAAPFNRWAFHHVREIVPSADIPNDPARIAELPADPLDMGKLQIEVEAGKKISFDDYLQLMEVDGFVVLRNGKLVFKRYAHGMTEDT